ncbi:MAG: FUSC family protein [Hyphomicrobium sp.]|nr:FUSC family protein [Hyphomicrobium sp.]MBY0558318.1 FUSC family protein [Hyphomicrobium sp.]
MVRRQWSELESLANARSEPDFGSWTAHALDHAGQIAARIAVTGEGDEEHAADGLSDIRIGRNILHLRRAAAFAHGSIERSIDALLAEVAQLFRRRRLVGDWSPPHDSFWSALDNAIVAIRTMEDDSIRHQALLAAVGIRCNLLPSTSLTERAIAA